MTVHGARVNAVGLSVVLLSTMACTASTPPQAPPAKPKAASAPKAPPSESTKHAQPPPTDPIAEPPGAHTIEARVEIDAKPGGKKFQGVWLVQDGGSRHVISYRVDPLWRTVEGRRVKATGETYEPPGQAILASHFRVHTLEVIGPMPEDSIVRIAEEREMQGRFAQHDWPSGAKLEGEITTVFVADSGVLYQLANAPDDLPAIDAAVVVTAREVEPSPFAARVGGAYLWILDAK